MNTNEQLARLFHDTYERLAPEFGYETRKDTKAFDPTSPNGRLMMAVCKWVADSQTKPLDAEVERLRTRVSELEGGIAQLMVCTDNGCPAGCVEDQPCWAYDEMVKAFQRPSRAALRPAEGKT